MPHMRALPKNLDPEHARLIQADNITAVIEAVQMGSVEFHTWNARSDRIERPDRVIFDLDPDPALPWASMVEATKLTLALLDELGLRAFLKTSGGRGMHVVVPIERRYDWDCARSFARSVTERLARESPQLIVDKMGPQNRVGRIFVDYLRNQKGASTVAAYSVRARPGLGVSLPVSLEEVRHLEGADQWRLGNVRDYLSTRSDDPWSDYGNTRQRLGRELLERLREGR